MKHLKNIAISFIILFSFINVYDAKKEEVALSKCVDGDTARFIYNGEEIKARFLAIDTPETVHPTKEVMAYGKDASEYTCYMLTNAETIEIEYDEGSTKKDKYDRDLVWIFVDGELLQEKLVSVGYAQVKYIYGDYYYTDHLYEVENTAKESKLGIWHESDENKTVDKKDENKENKEKDTITFVINGNKIEINKSNTTLIIIVVIIAIILVLTNKKTKIKIKK